MAERICVARIGAAHGVRGEVRLSSFTADPMAVARLRRRSRREDGTRASRSRALRPAKDALVARFKGVHDRTAAERLRNVELYVPRDRLPPPEDDEFYHADLVGLAAVARGRRRVGTVVAIHNFGAGDLLEIAPRRRTDAACCRSPTRSCRRSTSPAGASWWCRRDSEPEPR